MAEEAKNPEAPAEEVPTITAGDLNLMVNIIDAGSQRGAWRGEELSTVGNLRTKLAAVVKAVTPAAETAEGGTQEVQDEEQATEEAAKNG